MKTNAFCLHSSGFFVLMKMDSKTARWDDDRALPIIRNMSPLYFLHNLGFPVNAVFVMIYLLYKTFCSDSLRRQRFIDGKSHPARTSQGASTTTTITIC